ncbi:MAG: sensor histidine kinase [Porcipelethomonas sp.]
MFFPTVIYELMRDKNRYIRLSAIPVILLSFFRVDFPDCAAVFAISMISAVLSFRTAAMEAGKDELIRLRDASEENRLLLTEKNRYLISGRDNEVNLAVLSERNRIAREIHDNVGHMLSRTLLQMGALGVINKDENIKPYLDEINSSLNNAMTSIRESVHNLHDDSVCLSSTIKEIIKPLEENYTVKLDMDISENASREVKFCFIGIIKEAVSNILRHSSGDSVAIALREHPAFYQAWVEDNGKNTSAVKEGGIGLENMKTRAEKLGGIFQYSSKKDSFRIFVSIPKEKNI